MSKLAHSNDETMQEIERQRCEELGEPAMSTAGRTDVSDDEVMEASKRAWGAKP